jgi:hypothetical protein
MIAGNDRIEVGPIAEISPAPAFDSSSRFRGRACGRLADCGHRLTYHLGGNSTDEGRFESIAP